MRIAIDANRYADHCRGVPEATHVVAGAETVLVPFIVLGELRAAFRYGTHARENERKLSEFVADPAVSVLWPDHATAHALADLYSDLRRAGKRVPSNDLWIAALCIQHSVPLFTRDRHFELIPRLARL